METLAEVIYQNGESFRQKFGCRIPRFDTIPRIQIAETTINRMVIGTAHKVTHDEIISGVRAVLGNMDADEVWIEYAGENSLSGGSIRSVVDGIEVSLWSCTRTRLYGNATGWIKPDGMTVKALPEERSGVLNIVFHIAVAAATLAEPGTPAELAPVDHAEERRTRETNKKRRRMGRPLDLPCRPIIWNLDKVPAWDERRRMATSRREQARPHAVRGHWRHYKSGKAVQIRPHFRCGIPESMGRDYRVRA